MTQAAGAAFVLIVPLAVTLAQSTSEGIEVASIKPSHSASRCGSRFQPGGTMSAACVTLNDLIQWAFNLRPNQIAGGPEWIRSAAYDITAKLRGIRISSKQELIDRIHLYFQHINAAP